MRILRTLSLSLLASACGVSFASAECTTPNPSVVSATDILIDRTERIVIAELAPLDFGASPEEADDPLTLDREKEIKRATEDRDDRTITKLALLRFSVLEDVKGGGQPFVFMAGLTGDKGAAEDFDAHRADEFWSDPQIGRAHLGEDCRVEASFAEGERYLIFVGAPHVKAYETVKADDDKWLDHVRARVSPSN